MKKKAEEDDVQRVEVELVRIVERLRAMRLGRYACTMWDGSTVRIEIKKTKEPRSLLRSPSWEERIAAWLKKHKPKEVRVAKLLEEALGITDAGCTPADTMRAVRCLRDLGWTRRFLRGNAVWGPARPS